LQGPDYVTFSNSQSAHRWRQAHDSHVVVLEEPYYLVHLSVGGFTLDGGFESGLISGANGDVGENETGAFDPVFFLHHCYADVSF